MKKIQKGFAMFLSVFLSVQIVLFGTNVQAKTIKTVPKKSFDVKLTTKENNDLLNKYPMLKKAGLQKKKLVSQQQMYVEYVEDGSTTKKLLYTKNQYEKLPNIEKNISQKTTNVLSNKKNPLSKLSLITTNDISITPPPRSNSWMQLTFNIYTSDFSHYDIYGFYQWLSVPNYKDMDVVGISHGVGLTFDYASCYADICNPYGGIGTIYTNYTEDWSHYTYYGTPDNFKGQVGGIGCIFKLCHNQEGCGYEDGDRICPYGMVYASATRSDNSVFSCELCLTYDHQEKVYSITPSINIPLGGTISITNTTSYDPFDLSYALTMD